MKRRHKIGVGLALGAVATAILITFLLTVVFVGGHGHLVFTFGGPHGTPQKTVTVPAAAVAQVESSDLAHHEGLRSENPPNVPAAQLDASRIQQEKLAESSALPNVTPDAAPQQRGCVTRLVRNYSTRRGVPPRIFVLHYTVSPNRTGWSDVYAVAGLFDRAAFQASSNYITDDEGHCLYIVRESDKAWTQAAANPFAISVEQINTGHEPTYAGSAGLAKIALIVHDAAHRWHFPIQQGLVAGCLVVRPGIVDHNSLGACGGGHHDITPYSVDMVIQAAKALDGPPVKPKPKSLAACTVRNLQARLGLAVDGVVGPKTRAAISAVQRKHGWRVTGQAGRKVGKALQLKGCAI